MIQFFPEVQECFNFSFKCLVLKTDEENKTKKWKESCTLTFICKTLLLVHFDSSHLVRNVACSLNAIVDCPLLAL